MSLAMTKAEREAFLAETRVAVISVPEPGRGPLLAEVRELERLQRPAHPPAPFGVSVATGSTISSSEIPPCWKVSRYCRSYSW